MDGSAVRARGAGVAVRHPGQPAGRAGRRGDAAGCGAGLRGGARRHRLDDGPGQPYEALAAVLQAYGFPIPARCSGRVRHQERGGGPDHADGDLSGTSIQARNGISECCQHNRAFHGIGVRKIASHLIQDGRNGSFIARSTKSSTAVGASIRESVAA
ncbi:hypothetical protein GCM10025331_33260 [Actinoplanes utahensis]|nr:hypothetical protein Aut01nite_48150 [Actinoplanes utahensis]